MIGTWLIVDKDVHPPSTVPVLMIRARVMNPMGDSHSHAGLSCKMPQWILAKIIRYEIWMSDHHITCHDTFTYLAWSFQRDMIITVLIKNTFIQTSIILESVTTEMVNMFCF